MRVRYLIFCLLGWTGGPALAAGTPVGLDEPRPAAVTARAWSWQELLPPDHPSLRRASAVPTSPAWIDRTSCGPPAPANHPYPDLPGLCAGMPVAAPRVTARRFRRRARRLPPGQPGYRPRPGRAPPLPLAS